MVLKYWKMMTRSVKSISSRCSGRIFCRIDRVVSLVLVAALLLCCVPALAVNADAVTLYYSYNGYILPKIPDPPSGYKWGFIFRTTSGSFVFSCFPSPNVYGTYKTDSGTFTKVHCIYYSSPATWQNSTLIDGSWSDFSLRSSSFTTEKYYLSTGNVLWSNYDIQNLDTGGTYLAASLPVLVGDDSGGIEPPPVGVENIITSFNGQYIYSDVDTPVNLLFMASGYDSLTLYLNVGALSDSVNLVKDADSGVLYGGFTFTPHDSNAVYDLIVTAFSGDVNVGAFSATVDSSGSSPGSTDQYNEILTELDNLGVSVDEVQDSLVEVDNNISIIDDKVDELLSGGDKGPDLSDQGGQISDDVGQISDYEQSQKDVLDNNIDGIMGQVDFVNLIPALAFVGGYINNAWESMMPVQLIYTVPLFLGLFFFLCSRIPGATRWKPRRPPPDPTKK